MKTLIKNGRVVDPSQNIDAVLDILVEDGKIASLGANLEAADAEVYDASGLVVTPGLIDMHTHLREPGLEAKEDIISGTQAAAAGGVTTVACMPNTKPVIDNSIIVTGIKDRAAREGFARVEVVGCISQGQKGEALAEMGDMTFAGAVGFSDDGHYVDSSRTMLLAARYVSAFDRPLMCHAIDTEIDHMGYMHEGVVSARTGIPGSPYIAEDIAVARDCIIAEYTGAHVHICHCASKGAIDIVRQYKAKGVNVTAECTVHHLTLTDEECSGYSAVARVNPPLRSMDHVEAMRAAVLDGTVDCIVTDHSPHAHEEKDVEFRYAPNGFTGLETSLGVVLTDLYHTGIFDLKTIVSKMSCEPAKVFKLDRGTLAVGAPADITIMDLNKEWTVDCKKFYTRGKFTPYNGKHCKGKAVATMLGGRFVMKDGIVG